MAFAADAARNTVGSDPDGARALITGLRSDVADAIVEIRRLLEGLRPPALDELGLLGALRQHAARMLTADGRPLAVHLTVAGSAPGPVALPPLAAAIEVATYRIVVEALTNVARHADGSNASVSLEPAPRQLRIEIRDSGCGRGQQWTPGVGLTSMRTRAEQLGGTSAPATAGSSSPCLFRIEVSQPGRATSSHPVPSRRSPWTEPLDRMRRGTLGCEERWQGCQATQRGQRCSPAIVFCAIK